MKTNLYGEDITKVRRQQFEVSTSRNARAMTLSSLMKAIKTPEFRLRLRHLRPSWLLGSELWLQSSTLPVGCRTC